jgi:hypothetical protein
LKDGGCEWLGHGAAYLDLLVPYMFRIDPKELPVVDIPAVIVPPIPAPVEALGQEIPRRQVLEVENPQLEIPGIEINRGGRPTIWVPMHYGYVF